MNHKEATRYALVRQVLQRKITQAQAALQLGLSQRQVKRLRQAREHGVKELISKRHGKPSNRRIADAVREHFMAIVHQRYADFGPHLACEYLRREHGFEYSVETLRGWMRLAGLWQAKSRAPVKVHSPRARRTRLVEHTTRLVVLVKPPPSPATAAHALHAFRDKINSHCQTDEPEFGP